MQVRLGRFGGTVANPVHVTQIGIGVLTNVVSRCISTNVRIIRTTSNIIYYFITER